MTLLDYKLPQTVYYKNSNFPCEYGGGRRQKHARTRGLNIQPEEKISATTRKFDSGKWVIYTTDADGRIFNWSIFNRSARESGLCIRDHPNAHSPSDLQK